MSVFWCCSADAPYANSLKWSEREGSYEGAYFDEATNEPRGISIIFENDGKAIYYYWTYEGVMRGTLNLIISPFTDNDTKKLTVTFKDKSDSRPPFTITALSDTEISIEDVYTSDNNPITLVLTKKNYK